MDVDAYALAERLDITAPSERVLRKLDRAIADAVADVWAFVGPILPHEVTETGKWPLATGWDLEEAPRRIISTTAETFDGTTLTGTFTVVYEAGRDWRTDPDLEPIRRYVMAAAENTPSVLRLWQETTGARGPIKTVSTEGQSVSYGDVTRGGGGAAGSGAPGSMPLLASLAGFKQPGVYQGKTRGVLPGRAWMRP